MLQGKKIIIGICGSIAAYKAAILTRAFIKEGAEVKVIMTSAATSFIPPLTLSTLSKNDVVLDFTENETETWNNHVELGLWADAFVIAPLTANSLGKMANGLCDNMLLACYLSAKCPVFVAPAMDLDMWKHPSTQNNIQKIISYGNQVIPVEHGELASGLIGKGRMAEPETIVEFLKKNFQQKKNDGLKGKKVLITAGPTHEPIDAVRYIGNRSSGKMGIALAEAAANSGAEVFLVLGPSNEFTNHPNVSTIKIETANDLFEQSSQLFKNCDIAICAAAVADYKPKSAADNKIKKSGGDLKIDLVETKDTLKYLGSVKAKNQLLVGFALETDNEIANATKKLNNKNLDLIVLNSLNDKGAGFGHNTNKVTLITKSNTQVCELKSKVDVAHDIIEKIIVILKEE